MSELANIKILIVDDEKDLLDTLDEYFTELGAKTTLAENGQLAFELIQKNQYDVILTDIRMPVCSGIDLVNKIRTLKEKAPTIILMSAFSDISPNNLKDIGVSAFILKTKVMNHIVEIVKETLNKDE